MLNKKLLRDLRRLWLQSLAAAIVLGCGVAVLVMATGTYSSLERARDDYYATAKMADLASALVRAPLRTATQLSAIDGVAALEARVMGLALIDIAGVEEPVSAQLVSLPAERFASVNDLILIEGRWPRSSQDDEALLNSAFASAHGLTAGATLTMLLNGKRKTLQIVGLASSPEFMFAVPPGELLPEPRRFGVLWMNQQELSAALGLTGAFNDLVLRLDVGANRTQIAAEVDRQLARFGGQGTYGRERMLSARYLTDELQQLKTLATFIPPIFLSIAVFLIHAILARMVAAERANIGVLKAFGYSNRTLGWHYGKFAVALALLGSALGIVGGAITGHAMSDIYREVYNLPRLDFRAEISTYLIAFLSAVCAALLGAQSALRRAVKLAAREALAPPAPLVFHDLGLQIEKRLGSITLLSRIPLRRLLHFPRRSLLSVIGIAMALALLIMSESFLLAAERLIKTNFSIAQRMDATVSLRASHDIAALHELARLPGVHFVEPQRAVEMTFINGHRSERDTLIGIDPDALLNRVADSSEAIVATDEIGVMLSETLANKLALSVGDQVELRSTHGRRTTNTATVSQIVRPFVGAGAYIEPTMLAAMLRESPKVDGVHLLIDPQQRTALNQSIKRTPSIVGITYIDDFANSLRDLIREGAGFFSKTFLVFATAMAAGVAFSTARVTIVEQQRDLATLRILGYGRRETSWVLLAEMGILLVIALPLGVLLGAALANWLMQQFATDMFSFPFIFDRQTYARSATLIALAVITASFFARRDVADSNMVGTLKS